MQRATTTRNTTAKKAVTSPKKQSPPLADDGQHHNPPTDAGPRLQPLPQALIVAHQLRRMAKDLILQAEALEASVPQPAATDDGNFPADSFFGVIKPHPRRLDRVGPHRGGK